MSGSFRRMAGRAVLWLALGATAAHAQPARSSRGAGWLPPRNNVGAGARFTPGERKEVFARLHEIDRILLEVNELANPMGFEVEPSLHTGEPGKPGSVAASRYCLTFYPRGPRVAGEGHVGIEVAVNVITGANATPFRDASGEIYFELEPGDAIPGVTHVWERLSPTGRSWTTVAFASGGRSPWKSVSREAFLESVIYAQEGKDSEDAIAWRKLLLQTPYQRWLTEAPEREKHREALIADVRRVSPAQGAQLRETLEHRELETAAQLKAHGARDRSDSTRILASPTLGERLRARIAAMSPAERATPAWLDRLDTSGDFAFVAPESPNAFHVVRPDPSFLRVRRSRVEARFVTVKISVGLAADAPAVHHALFQAYKNLDWRALAALVGAGPQGR